MLTSAYAAIGVPASIGTAVLLLRNGTPALLTLIAGLVAVLAPGKRGDRALAVLRLMRTPTAIGKPEPPRRGADTDASARDRRRAGGRVGM